MALTNKGDYRDICKEILDEIVKEKFNAIRELTDEINHDYLTYYFEGDSAK